MEEIKNYLGQEERDYQQGVALLGRFGKNRQLHLNLLKKHSPVNVQKLEYELAKLAEMDPPSEMSVKAFEKAMVDHVSDKLSEMVKQVVAQTGQMPIMSVYTNAPTGLPDGSKVLSINADQQYLALTEQMNQLFHERVKLSNTLEDLQSEEEQKSAVSRIQALNESYNALAEKKKYFDEHGIFPQEQKQEESSEGKPLDLAELTKSRNNLRTRVSKARAALAKKPNDVKKQEALAKLEVELNHVDLQVKIATEAKEKDGAE